MTDPLRIGITCYPSVGGSGVLATTLGEELAARGHDVHFIAYERPFRLPADAAVPIVMIGAGTGVAPFRAFAQQREIDGAPGRSWLFFGDRHFRTDFLYQVEWLEWLRAGVLSRMDVAFSRDQADKRYVQHLLEERSGTLYGWLDEGAALALLGWSMKTLGVTPAAVLARLRGGASKGELPEAERDVAARARNVTPA